MAAAFAFMDFIENKIMAYVSYHFLLPPQLRHLRNVRCLKNSRIAEVVVWNHVIISTIHGFVHQKNVTSDVSVNLVYIEIKKEFAFPNLSVRWTNPNRFHFHLLLLYLSQLFLQYPHVQTMKYIVNVEIDA